MCGGRLSSGAMLPQEVGNGGSDKRGHLVQRRRIHFVARSGVGGCSLSVQRVVVLASRPDNESDSAQKRVSGRLLGGKGNDELAIAASNQSAGPGSLFMSPGRLPDVKGKSTGLMTGGSGFIHTVYACTV